MRSWLLLIASLALMAQPGVAQPPAALTDYSPAHSQAELQWEARFKAMPDPANISGYDKYLSAWPHNAGTERDHQDAQWILNKFKQWGWDARIETFYVLLPWPKERQVEMVSPKVFKASLEEPPVAGDSTSSQQKEQLPTYNMYSADGDVTAPLVYVNYGMEADYKQLARMGISVKGAIVIARYGQVWRGLKPKLAGEHGAVGCLIYSDPRDDGYWKGDVFPKGPWRPDEGVQRGSVMDITLYPGDPLTPGWGATKDAKRLALKDAATITKIPVLPLSYADAQPLLAALTGPVVPEGWRGALPITYHIGPGPAKVHLKVLSDWKIRPIDDVIAKIPGTTDPDEWVIRGNHHDAWVNGAQDPLSGLTAELEEARALGELVKAGWKPQRTIIYCAWDGEEPALLGSTEWAEEHAAELQQHAVAYINSDSNGRGYLEASGSPSLQQFIDEVANDVQDPEKGISVEKRLFLRLITQAKTDADRKKLREARELKIGVLGSGSDYSAFIDHLGIPSLDLGYGGVADGGIYHSIYDDFYWYSHFGDPGFVYGKTLAQTAGSAVMRLADADLLPFNFDDLASAATDYLNQVKTDMTNERNRIHEQDLEVADGAYAATADPRQHEVPPKIEPLPPFLSFAPLENAVANLERSAKAYHAELNRAHASGGAPLADASLNQVNRILTESERSLTLPSGLPKRPWYKNELYAPGFYLGYDAQTLPAIHQEIEQKDWKGADEEIVVVSQVVNHEADLIESAATELKQAIH
ncbi:MAG TPA: M28 family metallopeptidase [Terriglobia bacterium]|nr:M28 family metallopeptidase [Terriglobia bacterium]